MTCIVFTLCMLPACIKEELPDSSTADRVRVGDVVPSFTASDGQGNNFSSSAFIGKRSLLVLFHTGCGDCQRELPVVEEVYKAVKQEADYQVITIAREEALASVSSYWNEQSFTMPFYLDTNRAVFLLFATSTIPRLYIINTKGVVTWMAVETLDGMNGTKLLQLLREQD